MKPYVPQALPLTDLDYARLIRKIGPANAALARYDGLLQSVINPFCAAVAAATARSSRGL